MSGISGMSGWLGVRVRIGVMSGESLAERGGTRWRRDGFAALKFVLTGFLHRLLAPLLAGPASSLDASRVTPLSGPSVGTDDCWGLMLVPIGVCVALLVSAGLFFP